MTKYRERQEAGEFSPDKAQAEGNGLKGLTKAELLDEAAKRGVDVDPSIGKVELREMLEGS